MQHDNLPASLLSLEQAIDRRPLTVSPGEQLAYTLAVMGKARASCVLPSLNLPPDLVLLSAA